MQAQAIVRQSARNDRPFLQTIVFGGALVATLAVFFRLQLINGFTVLFGDRGDAVIVAALLEHWFNVFRGLEPWDMPQYFYPHADILGYNEGFFLFGAIYAAFRFVGLDPFLSSELVTAAVKIIGFAGFFLATREIFRISFIWALFGAVLFTLAHNSFTHAFHAQLQAIAFAPVFWFLVARVIRAMIVRPGGAAVAAWGAGAALFYAAWLISAYYMAWFTGFFTLVLSAILLVMAPRAARAETFRVLQRNLRPLFLCTLIAATALLPFLIVYLPKARETGMHPFATALSFTPSLLDIVNVGSDNWMFGRIRDLLIRITCPDCYLDTDERTVGLAPLLLLVFLVAGATLRPWRDRHWRTLLVTAIALAVVLCWALAVHVGEHSAWYAIYQLVPGAAGVRVIARLQIFLTAPLLAVVVWFLARSTSRVSTPVLAALSGLLLFAEMNTGAVDLDRRAALARVMVTTPAPPSCTAFFVSAAADQGEDGPGDALFKHNADAMLISELTHLPTINGFATFTPPDWNFASPRQPDYLSRVRHYATAHNLTGLCRLDLPSQRWQPLDQIAP